MTYKGYEADVEFDEEARVFHGEVVNIAHDVITFEGRSVDELVSAFENSVDEYLELCASRGEQPEEPLSMEMAIAIPIDVRRKLMLGAKREAKSVERFISDVFRLRMATGGASNY